MAQLKKDENSKSLESLLQSLKEQKEALEKLTKTKSNTAHEKLPSTTKRETDNSKVAPLTEARKIIEDLSSPEDSSERLTRLAKEAWRKRQLKQSNLSPQTASIPNFQWSPSKILYTNVYKKHQNIPNNIKQPENGLQPRNNTFRMSWIRKPGPNAVSMEYKCKNNAEVDQTESRCKIGSKYSIQRKISTESSEIGNKGNSEQSESKIEKQLTLATTKIFNSSIASNCDKSRRSRGSIETKDNESSCMSNPEGLKGKSVVKSTQTNMRQNLLKDSSARLSLLAKQTWQSSTSKRKHSPIKPRVQIPPKSALKISRSSVIRNSQEKTEKTRGDVKHEPCRDIGNETRIGKRVESNRDSIDHLNLKKCDKNDVDDSANTTDERLSALARRVWQGKAIQQRPKPMIASGSGRSKKHTWRKDILHVGTLGKRTQYKLVKSGAPSAFKWRSEQTGNRSFLQRRKSVILKQNRFKIVKVNHAAPDQKTKKKSPNHVGLNVSWHSRYSLNKRRTSFVKRRQAFLSEHSHSTSSTIWLSTSSEQGSIYKKNNLVSGRPKKANKDSPVVFTSVSGKKFVSDKNGRRLRRASFSSPFAPSNSLQHAKGATQIKANQQQSVIQSSKYRLVRRRISVASNASKLIASQMVKKSVTRLQQQKLRKYVKKQYCMFYNRFGKCKNGDKCRFVHDPDKVAVCTRFLRGTCKDEKCLFSHKVDKDKMPTCVFFLRGACHRDNCPYAHVKVSGTAAVCKDFLKGHCPAGDKCLKRHILECEQFSTTGQCDDGDKCQLYHRKKSIKRRRQSSLSETRTPKPFAKRSKLQKHEERNPDTGGTAQESQLQIKPVFLMKPRTEGISRKKRRFDWKRESEQADETKAPKKALLQ